MEGTQTNTPADGRKQQPARLAGLWPYWPAVLVGMLLLYTFVLVIAPTCPRSAALCGLPGSTNSCILERTLCRQRWQGPQ